MSADYDYMNTDDMCPNCVTPWKCNGPHLTTCQKSTENGTEMAYRVAAFGAIRRAATEARYLERAASVLHTHGDPKTRARVALQFRMEARAMRRAIRAALNTEKKA